MTDTRRHPGFTLIEILIVLGIIGLVMLIVLPNVGTVFASQARAQARNQIDAQLKVARSLAIRDRVYTGVHFQRHHTTGEYWSAIVQATTDSLLGREDYWPTPPLPGVPYDTGYEWAMRLAEGTQPARLPTGIGVGAVGHVIPGVNIRLQDDYGNLGAFINPPDDKFTTFTVLFDPDGHVVTNVPGAPDDRIPYLRFSSGGVATSPLFLDTTPGNNRERAIWELPKFPDPYARALCVFDAVTFDALPDAGAKAGYLNENARFLVVAPYVGGLIRTAVE